MGSTPFSCYFQTSYFDTQRQWNRKRNLPSSIMSSSASGWGTVSGDVKTKPCNCASLTAVRRRAVDLKGNCITLCCVVWHWHTLMVIPPVWLWRIESCLSRQRRSSGLSQPAGSLSVRLIGSNGQPSRFGVRRCHQGLVAAFTGTGCKVLIKCVALLMGISLYY